MKMGRATAPIFTASWCAPGGRAVCLPSEAGEDPSYLGLLILSLGWALAFRSLVGVLLVALTLVPLVARIRSEEALLRSQFGAEYDAYRARKWRLVPGIY